MTTFNLPDLGEGLPDAEIREWYVQLNDVIKVDQPMVAMETAKALVDIPAPFSGRVTKLFGKAGDIIKTGNALIDIEGENSTKKDIDQATVVGNLQLGDAILEESPLGIQPKQTSMPHQNGIKATPAIRALAKKFQININDCEGTGPDGQILVADVEKMLKQKSSKEKISKSNTLSSPPPGYEPLRGVRRVMASTMKQAQQSIVPITLVDDADIHAWPEKTDITLRLIRAVMAACQREPRLNAWFDESQLAVCQHSRIDLGIAMDASEGLFVPVLKNVAQESAVNLRKTLDKFKLEVKNRSISPDDLLGATFVLSNVGVFAGRYATPIVIPPMVAILAVGRINEKVVAEAGKISVHKQLPLSLTVDHRVITGGEAARFLSALIIDLEAV
ncbi:dihydrolipoamide acetyltransferase family protein [Rickettsiella endosymbiont of Miltochrista miniata]|uniref:dihydrolipoamide acetyltransferase family protein n=1 Tax=Rickettsiella endosymbiont of Miltochrista miniata TaxID=3066239 RepID=UPI00313AA9E3